MGILEITLKCCSFALEIPAFDTLYDCQSYSDLACHFRSGVSLHVPHVGKPSTHPLHNTGAIGLPWLRGQKKDDFVVSMRRCL